jgi:hypothetical protein
MSLKSSQELSCSVEMASHYQESNRLILKQKIGLTARLFFPTSMYTLAFIIHQYYLTDRSNEPQNLSTHLQLVGCAQ